MDLEIRQTSGLSAKVSFDGSEWEVVFTDPFTPKREKELRWYFEKHLEFPMLEKTRAEDAAASVKEYGTALFQQLFGDHELHTAFQTKQNDGEVRIVVTGDPEFHRLHWETLWKPGAPKPLANRVVIARKVPAKGVAKIQIPRLPVVRVLVVVARPGGGDDVGYRTISRPLVETLRQASLAVELEFVRPGTWERLNEHLTEREPGYYHALHFDGHGVVADVAKIEKLRVEGKLLLHTPPGDGAAKSQSRKGYLFFESDKEPGKFAIEAAELAGVMNEARIPVVILNACQSAMQDYAPESNLASRLSAAGVRSVLAMAYSVTVSAAREFMEAFYREVFAHGRLSQAVTRGRQQLLLKKRRNGYFGMQVELEDWMLPVLYENEPVRLEVRASAAEEQAFLARQAGLHRERTVKHGFWGRDLDILSVERRLLASPQRNILLLEGMGGTGKTTLLQHLAWWWQVTGLVERVFVFEYDQRAWTRQQILLDIADRLGMHLPPGEQVLQEVVVKRLRAERHLLVLDNLESVTGEHLAIGHSLAEGERANLREFLAKLRGGKSLVLVGSRGDEKWLAADTFGENVHPLRGLDAEARTSFGEEVLRSAGLEAAKFSGNREYGELLGLLAGHPLAMQVVLPNLREKSAAEVLRALREGDVSLDAGGDRTESILKCIDYSHTNLSEEARELLVCLAPFTGVVFLPALDKYVELLRKQPALAGLLWEKLPGVLEEAARWGLAKAEGRFLLLQPVFPFFLRSRVGDGVRMAAVEEAFREHYDRLCRKISQLIDSKDQRERRLGQVMGKLEYENSYRALEICLAAKSAIMAPFHLLSTLAEVGQNPQGGLAIAMKVLADLESYPAETLQGTMALELASVIDTCAYCLLSGRLYSEARTAYERAFTLCKASSEPMARHLMGGVFHQLGVVAQRQGRLSDAGKNYREALKIFVEWNDRYSQAHTYHQLGIVAQEQSMWTEALENYREALKIFVEFNDRYSQAHTYHQFGTMAQGQGMWTEAEANYREALKIYVEFEDRYKQAATYHQLGIVAQEQGRWTEAEDNYREVLKIFVDFNDRYEQAGAYHQLGRVAQHQRRWTEAEANYREALKIFVEFDSYNSQARTYHQLGMVAQEQRQWAEAEQNGLAALALFHEHGDAPDLTIVLGLLARISAERPALAERVAEILGETTAEVADLLQHLSSPRDSSNPEDQRPK